MTTITSPVPSVWPAEIPPARPSSPRIEALDVVRGFALIGITLMNIEFFNRPIHSMGSGMATGLTGIDWLAGYLIAYLVQGKFWTIFSTLFGMGFAVMLSRAEQDGRAFVPTYLRRILGLAVFGAAHYIFLWDGDILFSYAVAACALMLLLYARWKPLLIASAAIVGISFLPGLDSLKGVAGAMAYMALLALYLRDESKVMIRGREIPLFSLILGVIGAIALIAAIVLWTLPNMPKGPRVPATIAALVLLTISFLSAAYRGAAPLRALRLGVTGYLVGAIVGILFGAVQYLKPPAPESPAPAAVTAPAAASASARASASAVAAAAASLPLSPAEKAAAADIAESERIAREKQERAERIAKRKQEIEAEIRVLKTGSYLDTVFMRASAFLGKAAGDAGFATLLICMFLLGTWFVRSGVMENTKENLPLFRKLALYGLPVGIGLGMAGSLIATSSTPGMANDGYGLARSLTMLGNLPASVGYISLVVVMLHSATVFSGVRLLAPFGRMALTNYVVQSLICSFVFYGYGLGQFGMARATQVVFVLTLVLVQIAFSHWWMARFRYGPLEWVWRGFTNRTMPQMRL